MFTIMILRNWYLILVFIETNGHHSLPGKYKKNTQLSESNVLKWLATIICNKLYLIIRSRKYFSWSPYLFRLTLCCSAVQGTLLCSTSAATLTFGSMWSWLFVNLSINRILINSRLMVSIFYQNPKHQLVPASHMWGLAAFLHFNVSLPIGYI